MRIKGRRWTAWRCRSRGAQEIGKALENINLGKVAESLPFKFPFGR